MLECGKIGAVECESLSFAFVFSLAWRYWSDQLKKLLTAIDASSTIML